MLTQEDTIIGGEYYSIVEKKVHSLVALYNIDSMEVLCEYDLCRTRIVLRKNIFSTELEANKELLTCMSDDLAYLVKDVDRVKNNIARIKINIKTLY